MDNNFNTDILQVCRTCLKEITDTSFFYLDFTPAANTQLTIRQKLCSSIPELDLSIVSDPVICRKCVDNILSVFEFKKNCLQAEIQINEYIQQVQHTGDLNLVDVLQFHQAGIENLDIEVELENLEMAKNFKNEDLVCSTSAFNEASGCTDSTEPEYLLELAMVETEDVIFNAFDDYNINYNLSASKENSDTHNSNIVQNCLPEVIEHQGNYSKHVNTSVYYQCYKCGHKAESKFRLILHLKHHTRKHVIHNKAILKRLSRYRKNLFGYYRCSFCNYFTKYKCLFDFHSRIHLTKKNYKQFFKHTDVQRNAFHTTIKVNKINIKGTNKRKCVKNYGSDNKDRLKTKISKEPKLYFSNPNNLKPNMRPHIVEKLFKCSICKYQCNCKVSLKRHMKFHIGVKPFSCSVCEYQCSQKSQLKRHVLIHTGEKLFSCSLCEYQFSRKDVLKRHMQTHTGEKPFSCSFCKYKYSRKEVLKRHMRIHTGEKPFSCSVCKYQCSRKDDLKQHMRIHTGDKPFSCFTCEYQCSRKEVLKQHMKTHTGNKPFSCFACKYQCSRKNDLKQHTQIHTGEKPFSCFTCKYKCSRKEHLKLHMRIHTGEKPFSCFTCKYKCSRKEHLKLHLQIHTREKPFLCSVCEYRFSQKSHLKEHILIHTGEKPFSCSVCEYQFNQKGALKRHMQIHTGDKPFSCSACKYQCSRKELLKRHMLIHTGEKPFSCSVCEYQCSRKTNLKRHMQIHT